MSSIYDLLCISHDPAVRLNIDLPSGDDGRVRVEAILAAHTAGTRPVEGHPRCDLVAGRYSYPLVEVYCPPPGLGRTHVHHRGGGWFTVEALRVLQAARDLPGAPLARYTEVPGCWSVLRLAALRTELGMSCTTIQGDQT